MIKHQSHHAHVHIMSNCATYRYQWLNTANTMADLQGLDYVRSVSRGLKPEPVQHVVYTPSFLAGRSRLPRVDVKNVCCTAHCTVYMKRSPLGTPYPCPRGCNRNCLPKVIRGQPPGHPARPGCNLA